MFIVLKLIFISSYLTSYKYKIDNNGIELRQIVSECSLNKNVFAVTTFQNKIEHPSLFEMYLVLYFAPN